MRLPKRGPKRTWESNLADHKFQVRGWPSCSKCRVPALVAVHGGVCAVQQRLQRVAGLQFSHPYCPAHRNASSAVAHAYGVAAEYPAGYTLDVRPGVLETAIQNHDELITAKSADYVARAEAGLQLGAELPEEFIAGRVSVGIIQLFEPVQIDKQDQE